MIGIITNFTPFDFGYKAIKIKLYSEDEYIFNETDQIKN